VQNEVNSVAPFNVTGVPMGEVFRPQFNTTTLPVDPVSAIFNSPGNLAANVSALPVMLTYTRNESGYLIDNFIAGAQIANAFVYNLTINRLLGADRAKAFLDSGEYPLVAGPDGMRTSLEITLTDAVWRCVSHAVAAKYAAAGGNIYIGEWTEGTTYSFNNDEGGYCTVSGAVCHSDDIYPTFDSATNATASANATQLADEVRPLWAAFIKTGNPGENWKAFTANSTEADVFNLGNDHPLSTCPAGLWGDKVKWDWQVFSNSTNSPAAPPATSSTPAGGPNSGAPAGAPITGAVVVLAVALGAVAVLL
jgi:carboxylesterase type B